MVGIKNMKQRLIKKANKQDVLAAIEGWLESLDESERKDIAQVVYSFPNNFKCIPERIHEMILENE